MMSHTFYVLGKLIYRGRWLIIGLWLLAFMACIPFIPNITHPFKTTGFVDETSESAKTERYLNETLGYNPYNRFIIVYHSQTLSASSTAYQQKIKKSLSGLNNFPITHQIFYPKDNKKQISKDKHTAYVVVMLKSVEPITDSVLSQFRSALKQPTNMSMIVGGEPIFVEDVNKQTQIDLYHADFIATPLAVVTLIFVFGSIVAAVFPIILGGAAALIILTLLYFIGYMFTLSIFTLNIALLLGLCLCLDYSLLIISRFRDELAGGASIDEAVSVTSATAGKAVFFSGIAVFASLSALFLFPVNILFSVAVGGLVAVFVAVVTAMIVLPAILGVLNSGINRLPIRVLSSASRREGTGWRWLATKIVSRPYVYGICSMIILLLLGYPFLSARFGISDFRVFPEGSKNRVFFDTYAEKFNESELTPIVMKVDTKYKSILSKKNIARLYDLANEIKDNPLVAQVNSIVTVDNDMTKSQYYDLYSEKYRAMGDSVKKLLATTTKADITTFNIVSRYPKNSDKTDRLIKALHNLEPGHGLTLSLTGTPVSDRDVVHGIAHMLPYALLWIFVFTYIIMLILLRSLFLPIKAIVMNLLSLCACYGALVLVFQEGYLHTMLGFEPQGMLDISMLVIIFCALFGFSMDYEVFLLTRMRECYDQTKDNKKSIIFGIVKSSRIITSAALIVIFICSSFLVADVLMVKAFGLGIAVAIFVDAFLIRTVLVPSTMMLLNQWNWYLPKCIRKRLSNRQ